MRGVAAERFCVRNSGVTAVVEVSTVFTAIFTIRLLCSVYPVYFPFFFPASLVPFFVVCKITWVFLDMRNMSFPVPFLEGGRKIPLRTRLKKLSRSIDCCRTLNQPRHAFVKKKIQWNCLFLGKKSQKKAQVYNLTTTNWLDNVLYDRRVRELIWYFSKDF